MKQLTQPMRDVLEALVDGQTRAETGAPRTTLHRAISLGLIRTERPTEGRRVDRLYLTDAARAALSSGEVPDAGSATSPARAKMPTANVPGEARERAYGIARDAGVGIGVAQRVLLLDALRMGQEDAEADSVLAFRDAAARGEEG